MCAHFWNWIWTWILLRLERSQPACADCHVTFGGPTYELTSEMLLQCLLQRLNFSALWKNTNRSWRMYSSPRSSLKQLSRQPWLLIWRGFSSCSSSQEKTHKCRAAAAGGNAENNWWAPKWDGVCHSPSQGYIVRGFYTHPSSRREDEGGASLPTNWVGGRVTSSPGTSNWWLTYCPYTFLHLGQNVYPLMHNNVIGYIWVNCDYQIMHFAHSKS